MSSTLQKKKEANLRKKRSAVKSTLTKLGQRVMELEHDKEHEDTAEAATLILEKIQVLQLEYKTYHEGILDHIDAEDEDGLESESETLYQQDEYNDKLVLRLKRLISDRGSQVQGNTKAIDRKLKDIKETLLETKRSLNSLDDKLESLPAVQQHSEELQFCNDELRSVRDMLIMWNISDDHDLAKNYAELKKLRFECSCTTKELTAKCTADSRSTVAHDSSNKFQKLEVPHFNGDIIGWRNFWSMFDATIHKQTKLTNIEKLLYLKQAVRGGPAAEVIECLSHTEDNYVEAIECLKNRYDRPRAIHEAHVKNLVDYPKLRDGSGKELRKLHDIMRQNLMALETMGTVMNPQFITSMIQLKLDSTTYFAWKEVTKESSKKVPDCKEILRFLDQRATSITHEEITSKKHSSIPLSNKKHTFTQKLASAHVSTSASQPNCKLCSNEKHPLYTCSKFISMSIADRRSLINSKNGCFNCLRSGHRAFQCTSSHRCKQCQKPHHTLLHQESDPNGKESASNNSKTPATPATSNVVSNAAATHHNPSLLMTCKVKVSSPDGNVIEARALLDSGANTSLITERVKDSLKLSASKVNLHVSGLGGDTHGGKVNSIVNCCITPIYGKGAPIDITAVVTPKITVDLPTSKVHPSPTWTHLRGLRLADPTYSEPGRIDVLLGIDVYLSAMRQGRRTGPPGSPYALETDFGWVLGGCSGTPSTATQAISNLVVSHALCSSADELLRKFWEIEEAPKSNDIMATTPEEKQVLEHFEKSYTRLPDGRFVVPLPRSSESKPLGESRTQAVRRFYSLEHSLCNKGKFQEVDKVIQEYLDLQHAEVVPQEDIHKDVSDVYYMPIHVVYKQSSTTTKVRAVFDASAKTGSGYSLNDTLMVGPTVHPPLLDVILRFRTHQVALTTDISKMYRAVSLTQDDRDYHRFVWRKSSTDPLQDYRMTRVTFGISASCFAANMAVKKNAQEFSSRYPLAAKVAQENFYVDDGLSGADGIDQAIHLRMELQQLFNQGGFELRKWNSSEKSVLDAIPPELRESDEVLAISDAGSGVAKTLGISWNTRLDAFFLSTSDRQPIQDVTKRLLLSDVSKIYDALGWFVPATTKMKILLQKTWELNLQWDEQVPDHLLEEWKSWRSELSILQSTSLPRCYYLKNEELTSIEIHGFCDASEDAYGAVVYLKSFYKFGKTHVALVMAKSKVAPIRRQSIPRLELCGAVLLARLLKHFSSVLDIPVSKAWAWTDSTIVLDWLSGSPKRFKTFVGNRVSEILDSTSPSQWRHVPTASNPADCASRGMSPSELSQHHLWWEGPSWLKQDEMAWPIREKVNAEEVPEELRITLTTIQKASKPIVSFEQYSSYSEVVRITAWILRFIDNSKQATNRTLSPHLSVEELQKAEQYLLSVAQRQDYEEEIVALQAGRALPKTSDLKHLFPFLDDSGLIRAGGRIRKSDLPYEQKHPIVLKGSHYLAKLLVREEHKRMLHAGPINVFNALSTKFHFVRGMKSVKSIIRQCVTCRRQSTRTMTQQVGQLPKDRVSPSRAFEKVGVDYAGPFLLKLGKVRKPVVVKAYVSVFICLSTKAVHLELVSDLTKEAFLATLKRFIARRGIPEVIRSDNGTNFIGACNELKELYQFLAKKDSQTGIVNFCTQQRVKWSFIPEHSPHFGGIWEAAVKSTKTHLRRIVGSVKLTYEELTTVLTQVEAVLNSRPLVPMVTQDGEGVEALTPGHFLIGKSLCSLPDKESPVQDISHLKRWQLCQRLTQHFWQRWSKEYLQSLRRFYKWHCPQRNLQPGDVVVLQEDGITRNSWPIGRVEQVFQGMMD